MADVTSVVLMVCFRAFSAISPAVSSTRNPNLMSPALLTALAIMARQSSLMVPGWNVCSARSLSICMISSSV